MRALIVGANGQLGRSLAAEAPRDAVLVCLDRASLDITDGAAVAATIADMAPDVILNAAAYTAVDRAESDEAAAHAVNTTAVGHLAASSAAAGAHFVHVSTDFVFDGASGSAYAPDAATNPLGVYGRTKAEGEALAGADALVVRAGWVYGPTGANFVRTMLRLMQAHAEVRVVVDQVGTPTYAPGLARALWALAEQRVRGVYHYSDSGVASWYDFAVAILEVAFSRGLLTHAVPVAPITTADFPTPAARPAFSVLDKTQTWRALGAPAPHWRMHLRRMLDEIKRHG